MRSWFAKLWHRLRGGAGAVGSDDGIDPEVREIFLSELDEVTETLQGILPKWRARPHDAAMLASVRRGFHTLKGSGNTVGATNLGEFCGVIEKLVVRLIEKRSKPTIEIIAAIADAVDLLPACRRAFAEGKPLPPEVRDIAGRVRPWL